MKYVIVCLSFLLLCACNRKSEKEEGEAYNPYDTSEQVGFDSISDATYTLDSLENSQKSRQEKRK